MTIMTVFMLCEAAAGKLRGGYPLKAYYPLFHPCLMNGKGDGHYLGHSPIEQQLPQRAMRVIIVRNETYLGTVTVRDRIPVRSMVISILFSTGEPCGA